MILKEARRLHSLGMAIHWLRPKSKMPIEKAWTKGKKKDWNELKKVFNPKFNVGVRLGRESKINDGYLAVIDCDIKSTDKKHQLELEEKLKDLIQVKAPIVFSGRGNGSKHIYVRTKEPISPFRFSQSKDKVKVLMPSVKPSKNDLAKLTAKEIKQGLRLRAAWEISVMGEGQQVVLPPSIHPDSGKTYKWDSKDCKAIENIPLVEFGAIKKSDNNDLKADSNDFNFVEVDLIDPRLPNELVELIVNGKGCEDRSASLFKVSKDLIRLGFKKEEVLSILTDKDYYLGSCAYDHAKTSSRKKAAEWIQKYTFKKAKAQATFEEELSEEIDEKYLDKKDAVKQSKELKKSEDWKYELERNKFDIPYPTMTNIARIVRGLLGSNSIKHNEFSLEDTWSVNTPWRSKKGKSITDQDVINLKYYMAKHYRLEANREKISEVLAVIADENKFHPVRDYLSTLEWDGVKRVDNWLKYYLGAEGPEKYLATVGRKFLVAMVKRVFEPGCNFHYVLILEGKQRKGKSETARILGGEWFNDSAIDIRDKDSKLHIKGIWLQELAELATMHKAEQRLMKNFISVASDRLRRPYGARMEEHKRQTVFIGTTNEENYLTDTTGNARYWPVKIDRLKRDELIEDRDQLFAEALQLYLDGENIEMLEEEIAVLAEKVQDSKMVNDDCASVIEEFLKSNDDENLVTFDRDCFRIIDIVESIPKLKNFGNGRQLDMKIAIALKSLGYEKTQKRFNGIKAIWWCKNEVSRPSK